MSVLFKSRNVKVITHTDLDGVSPKLILRCVSENLCDDDDCFNYDVECVQNSEMDEKIRQVFQQQLDKRTYDVIYIVDISPTSDETVQLINRFVKQYGISRVALFDHHKTSAKLKDYSWVYHSLDVCGTQLFWQHIEEDTALVIPTPIFLKLDAYVQYVNDWDTWVWKNTDKYLNDPCPAPDVLNTAFNCIGYELFEKLVLQSIYHSESLNLDLSSFLYLYKRDTTHSKEYATAIAGGKGIINTLVLAKACCVPGCSNTDALLGVMYSDVDKVSVFAHMILDQIPILDALLVISKDHISVRRPKNSAFDAISFVKQYGGGGHEDACGCPTTPDTKALCKWYIKQVLEQM